SSTTSFLDSGVVNASVHLYEIQGVGRSAEGIRTPAVFETNIPKQWVLGDKVSYEGDRVMFGGYNWRVVNPNTVMLVDTWNQSTGALALNQNSSTSILSKAKVSFYDILTSTEQSYVSRNVWSNYNPDG